MICMEWLGDNNENNQEIGVLYKSNLCEDNPVSSSFSNRIEIHPLGVNRAETRHKFSLNS